MCVYIYIYNIYIYIYIMNFVKRSGEGVQQLRRLRQVWTQRKRISSRWMCVIEKKFVMKMRVTDSSSQCYNASGESSTSEEQSSSSSHKHYREKLDETLAMHKHKRVKKKNAS